VVRGEESLSNEPINQLINSFIICKVNMEGVYCSNNISLYEICGDDRFGLKNQSINRSELLSESESESISHSLCFILRSDSIY